MPLREFQADLGSARYSIAHLVEKRRDILRYARSLPRGPRRDQLRQTAASLRALSRKKGWLDAHALVYLEQPNGAPKL